MSEQETTRQPHQPLVLVLSESEISLISHLVNELNVSLAKERESADFDPVQAVYHMKYMSIMSSIMGKIGDAYAVAKDVVSKG